MSRTRAESGAYSPVSKRTRRSSSSAVGRGNDGDFHGSSRAAPAPGAPKRLRTAANRTCSAPPTFATTSQPHLESILAEYCDKGVTLHRRAELEAHWKSWWDDPRAVVDRFTTKSGRKSILDWNASKTWSNRIFSQKQDNIQIDSLLRIALQSVIEILKCKNELMNLQSYVHSNWLLFVLALSCGFISVMEALTAHIATLTKRRATFKRAIEQQGPVVALEIISVLQNYITISALQGLPSFLTRSFVAAASSLQILHEINEAQQFTGASAFQNAALCDEADMPEEFRLWYIGDGVLFDFPFLLDLSSKRQVLNVETSHQQFLLSHAFNASFIPLTRSTTNPYFHLQVRRSHVLYDTMNEIISKRGDLPKELRVSFIGEVGVDQGGLRKEFFQLITDAIFGSEFGLFVPIDDAETVAYWFAETPGGNAAKVFFVGTVIALALYNGVLLDLKLPRVVFKRLINADPSSITFDDLAEAFPGLGRGLQSLLDYDGDVEEVFAQTFSVSSRIEGFDAEVELIRNGASIPVTNANRVRYVRALTRYRLVTSVATEMESLRDGFLWLFHSRPVALLKVLRPDELEVLLCGSPVLDFVALQGVARYEGYQEDDRIILDLWSILHSFDSNHKKLFLQFTTGSDRVPIAGMGGMDLVIARNGGDSDRLPASHTCYNHLLLPNYATKDRLLDRLLYAISHHSKGFGLS